MKTRETSIQSRLNFMIAAGYPFFVIGNHVSLPVEVEDYFAESELDELEKYILSCR